jgi:hypothetical protein
MVVPPWATCLVRKDWTKYIVRLWRLITGKVSQEKIGVFDAAGNRVRDHGSWISGWVGLTTDKGKGGVAGC